MSNPQHTLQRRAWLQWAGTLGLGSGAGLLAGCASPALPSRARVIVVGGGYGGATAAKYVRLLSGGTLDVLLIEPNEAFVSCPISNLVLGGSRTLAEITTPYSMLQSRHGVRHVRDRVAQIDAGARQVRLTSGPVIAYDKLIVAPGIDLNFEAIEGLRAAHDSGRVLQAWKAGAETVALRRQLEALPDGGLYALTIPEAPYRCPPGPYERASVIAAYFKAAKPRAKVLVLDANPDVTSKAGLFKKVWSEQYAGTLEYRPNHKLVGVEATGSGSGGTLRFDLQADLKADVLNVLPPMRAGAVAVQAGLATVGNRWAGVHYQSFESLAHPDIHVIGDSIALAPGMPKSGHMANNHAKVAAAAVVARLAGWDIDPQPVLTNTCYSFVDASRVVHVASVHEYVAAEKTYKPVAGAGGLSTAPTEQEGRYAWNWARTIWADALG
ncbi:MAG: FAD-dependent oxidoreductase [Burkholderiaceae bacterium]|nr:FAD-dependent oxidoreductase [Burkholderiaceae bacterium]